MDPGQASRDDHAVMSAPSTPHPTLLTPIDVVNIVTRNLVPIGGVLLFHWSAPNLLILYFADTLLSMAVLFGGLLYHFSPIDPEEGLADRFNRVGGYTMGALVITLIFAIPLGMPVAILVFGAGGHSLRAMLDDNGFAVGLAMQAAASLISLRALIAALRDHTPEELRLKRRFAILFLRWVCVIALAMTPFVVMFGRFGALLLVVAYAALTIFTEINPTRFLAIMGEKDDPQSEASSTSSAASGAPARGERRRRRPRR